MSIKQGGTGIALGAMLLLSLMARAEDSAPELIQKQPEPYRQVLSREIQWLANKVSAPKRLETYEPSTIMLRALTPSEEIQRMFPRHRFYAVKYTNDVRNQIPQTFPVRRATIGDVDCLYIVGPAGKHYKTLHPGAKDDHFVKLLQDNRITVRSAADARRIWNLYLDLEEMPNPDKYTNVPGYAKGRERLRNLPIRQSARKQWDIDQGVNQSQVQIEAANAPMKPTPRKMIYRLSLNADNTIASINAVEKPVSRVSL